MDDQIALAIARDQRFAVLQEAIAVEADMRDKDLGNGRSKAKG